MDWSMNTCSCVSTPSAMMGRFSRLAISMTDSTICLPLLQMCIRDRVIVVTQSRSRGKQERKIQQNAPQRRRHLQVEHFCNEALSVHTCSSFTNRYPLPHTVHTRLGF